MLSTVASSRTNGFAWAGTWARVTAAMVTASDRPIVLADKGMASMGGGSAAGVVDPAFTQLACHGRGQQHLTACDVLAPGQSFQQERSAFRRCFGAAAECPATGRCCM